MLKKRTRLMRLLLAVAAMHIVPTTATMPDPVTEADCIGCEQALAGLLGQFYVCESDIKRAQETVSGNIAGFKTYFSDVENQMKQLEPEKANLENTLSQNYAEEAKLYGQLRTERLEAAGATNLECSSRTTCGTCINYLAPNSAATHVCVWSPKYSSCLPYKTYSNEYPASDVIHTDAGYPGGSTCPVSLSFLHRRHTRTSPEDLLIDRWLRCDNDRQAAEVKLNGCTTKAKTVQMWDAQREQQYKEKSDVYIMRVSRMTDPLTAKLKESSRLSATIDRITPQIQTLKTERLEMICPAACSFPNCHPGEPSNGGVELATATVWGTRGCTSHCSGYVNSAGIRFCGMGDAYLEGGGVDCLRCAA